VGAVVGEQGVDSVGDGGNKSPEEVSGNAPSSALMQLGIGELAGSINGHKEIELALLGSNFGDIDMEVADGILLELLLGRFVLLDYLVLLDALPLSCGRSRGVLVPQCLP